jgi:hypothetical protein
MVSEPSSLSTSCPASEPSSENTSKVSNQIIRCERRYREYRIAFGAGGV